MAWVGAIAVIGLVLCGLDALRDRYRARHPTSPGQPTKPWWRRRWALMAAIATAVLIAAAAVFAFSGSTNTPNIVAPPTTTTAPTTTTTLNRGRPPQLVHLEVINASAVAKAAATKAVALAALGYPIVGTANAPVRQGTIVECKPGFDREANALAAAVAPGTLVQPFPAPAPVGSATADCVVVLGK